MAASVGQASLKVFRKLRVAVFATGDELRPPGAALPEGCIHDSNRFVSAALFRRHPMRLPLTERSDAGGCLTS